VLCVGVKLETGMTVLSDVPVNAMSGLFVWTFALSVIEG